MINLSSVTMHIHSIKKYKYKTIEQIARHFSDIQIKCYPSDVFLIGLEGQPFGR